MSNAEFLMSRLMFVLIFTGGFLYLTRELKCRYSPVLAAGCLAAALMLTYWTEENGFIWSLLRYGLFALIYIAWTLVFLRIRPRYAVYLSGVYVILMGVWLGCVKIVFTMLGIKSTLLLILCTGLCRLASVFIISRYYMQISPERDITVREIIISLFPAFTCFLANQVFFELISSTDVVISDGWRFAIYLLVLFFGASGLVVLAGSERYFKINKLRAESETATRQLEAQYQLFLREQAGAEQVKAMRHDIQNHLHTIEKMTQSCDAGLIREYVSDLQARTKMADSPSVTGNATLDALLSAKEPMFEREGIRLQNYLSLKDIEYFTPMEICTLFANAIDNAVEAVLELDPAERCIHLSGGMINDHLVVKIQNPYHHELRPASSGFASTKAGDGTHGYGLMNIEKIITEHNGTVSYKTDNGWFTMVWMIPVED